MPQFIVEATVTGFTKEHELWGRFDEKAKEQESAHLQLQLAFPGLAGKPTRLRGLANAENAELAMSGFAELVKNAGVRAAHEAAESGEEFSEPDWEGVEVTATPYGLTT